MQKLKKSSKNKSRFSVVVFYGTFAVGKYTVAKEFHKLTGYKFFHNHHAYDLAGSLFERDTIHIQRSIEKINFSIFKEIARAKINVVTTHTYRADFISRTGITDPNYMKKIETIMKKAGGQAYFIHLMASEKVLLKRVTGNSRKKFLKLKDPKILRDLLRKKKGRYTTSAPVKHNYRIDTSKLPPKTVASMVIKHFKLK